MLDIFHFQQMFHLYCDNQVFLIKKSRSFQIKPYCLPEES